MSEIINFRAYSKSLIKFVKAKGISVVKGDF